MSTSQRRSEMPFDRTEIIPRKILLNSMSPFGSIMINAMVSNCRFWDSGRMEARLW
jgi:hypothetical protein